MSLVTMTQRGLPVPPGFVLTVAFFQPWLDRILKTPEWAAALRSSPGDLQKSTAAVQALCTDLELNDAQRRALAQALEALPSDGEKALFAVRSSSPEEDLEGFSFAGGYETTLGVTRSALGDAIRRSFASCFGERIFAYKREHGLAVDEPRIAVIVQRQIGAETAGVAFSLNPINNCYDEAVINANYGLGESVVSGHVSPDSFIVAKGPRTLLERKLGKKETSVWLAQDGGTHTAPSPHQAQLCLSDDQALQIADLVARVEGEYGVPIDVEWAFAGGKLYLLQARPITAYVPLPEALLTAPGEPKRLYFDLTLTKWGMSEPLSVMGMDYIRIANTLMLRLTMGDDIGPDVADSIRPTVGGRTYVNASYSLKSQGKKTLADSFRTMDSLSAEIFYHLDEEEYLAPELPPALKGIVFKLIRQNLGTLWRGLQALRDPVGFKQRYLEAEAQLEKTIESDVGGASSLRELAESTMEGMKAYVGTFFSMLMASEIARSGLKRLLRSEGPEVRDRAVYLERGLPNNVTIEMGLAMYGLALFSEAAAHASGEAFARELKARTLSPEFLRAWDAFMDRYGFRCPMEMDPAAPRFYDQPAHFYEQLRTMAHADGTSSPQAIYDQARAQRESTFQELLQIVGTRGKRKAKRFAKNYDVLIEFGGYREKPKYYFVLITDLFRRQVLDAARSLVQAGRLDTPDQAFDLTIDQLDHALAERASGPATDLRALAEENTRTLRKLRHVREFPRVIDSRGKILRPPKRESVEGERVGEPISPGIVRGPIKVLHEPDEKPVYPGEILVAQATDPGWTPLFLNAGGVILEVGGMLQHGALVAREYGKPCVAGIENATGSYRDGQIVELDGTHGVVRLVQEPG
jgi:phosphohistidine swiveling domain-containing protein